ncbi:hypothetical protein RCL1_005906 [Eukaryota sp. TZLM3-RCL]
MYSTPVLLSLETPQLPGWLTRLPRTGDPIKDESDSDPEREEEALSLLTRRTRRHQDSLSTLSAIKSLSKPMPFRPLPEQKYWQILEERLESKQRSFQFEDSENLAASLVNMSSSMINKKYTQVKKQVIRMAKARSTKLRDHHKNLKTLAQNCVKEVKKRDQKLANKTQTLARAKKLTREVQMFWRKGPGKATSTVKRAPRKSDEQRAIEKKMEEEREARRQQRKLNFLLTQTELYSHFMLRKQQSNQSEMIAAPIVEAKPIISYDDDQYNETEALEAARMKAESAAQRHLMEVNLYNDPTAPGYIPPPPMEEPPSQPPDEPSQTQVETETAPSQDDLNSNTDPSSLLYTDIPQPAFFSGTLKPYQLKGMNWLVSLFDQGINGILADEMGLGKTIQSIAFLAHLAESRGLWGPFIVIGHSTILHNWLDELTKFAPKLKAAPYWGSPKERKVIRTMFGTKHTLGQEDSPFHVLITSYQFAVQDEKHFKRIKWQYMILDEAQAIKCHASQRWKSLLSFKCRNRLLLTGTPIQNSMTELWSLLHFIMPTLFDSHEEFGEWFSKGIEASAEQGNIDTETQHLRRLHLILKPFMLRREKKDVESELTAKVEVVIKCDLSHRQQSMYNRLKSGDVSLDGLLKDVEGNENESLMNLVMQLRKVCNHPAIFEKREPYFSYYFVANHAILPSAEPLMGKLNLSYSVPESSSLSSGQGQFRLFTRSFSTNPLSSFSFPNQIFGLLRHQSRTESVLKNSVVFDWLPLINQISRSEISRLLNLSFNLPFEISFLIDTINYFSKCSEIIRYMNDNQYLCNLLVLLQPTILNQKSQIISNLSSFNHFNELYSEISTHFYSLRPSVVAPQLLPHISSPSYSHAIRLRNSLSIPTSIAQNYHRFLSHCVDLPRLASLLTDSGKIKALDNLLMRLKAEGHRCLIYSQMTKMLDVLTDYMILKRFNFVRFDGSSSTEERRDLVKQFQTDPSLFCFLLSTRAGGIGINLTAADTVIFYDSDWNPTNDLQAMDRAHRLGQTKQVTVYRLICRNTIEERILERAQIKDRIQSLVLTSQLGEKMSEQSAKELLMGDEELHEKESMEANKFVGSKRRKGDEKSDRKLRLKIKSKD